jgi:ubiquinone/menaquinone biosynthesis C-methylase UbiE
MAVSWTDIDHSSNPRLFISFLDKFAGLSEASTYKKRTFELLGLERGSSVLDVGCGTGEDARSMTFYAGVKGRVVGIDNSSTMINEARQRCKDGAAIPEFYVQSLYSLEFGDNTFDCTRADRVLQHLPNPFDALKEMIRVTKAGGTVVVSDPDWDTLSFSAADLPTSAIVRRYICSAIHNCKMGRELVTLFTRARLVSLVQVTDTIVFADYAVASEMLGFEAACSLAIAEGELTHRQAADWLHALKAADDSDEFCVSITGYGVAGRKLK